MLTGLSGRTGPPRAERRVRRAHPGSRGNRGHTEPRASAGPCGNTELSGSTSHRGRRRWAAGALGTALAGAALFTLYLFQSLTSAVNSDGAANMLQGQAIDQGNLLLRGWWTSDVSFYPTELPEYALVTAVRGLSPDVVHLCGALTYTLTVLLALALARGRTRGPALNRVPGRGRDLAPVRGRDWAPGRASGWYGAGIAAGIMLAPSILGGTEVFLENPDHAGTAVPVLAVLLLLDRLPPAAERATTRDPRRRRRRRRRQPWPVTLVAGISGLLALTQLADPLSLAAATVPLAAVCAVRVAAAAIQRRPAAEFRDDWVLLAAAAGSAGLAWLAGTGLRSLGGFDVRPLQSALLAPLGQVPANARALWQSLVLLFGANNPGVPRQPAMVARHVPLVLIADSHVIGLALAAAGLATGITAFVRGRADRVTGVLAAAICVTLAAAILTQVMSSLAHAHEVAILVPLAAALAGRTLPPLARRLATIRPRSARPRSVLAGPFPAGPVLAGPVLAQPGRLAVTALAGWLILGVAELGYAAAWPASPPPMRAVAAWLVAHHELEGLAGYWQADVTTVASGGRVLVAPVTGQPAAVYRWESSAGWYTPDLQRATFVIATPGPASAGALTPAIVRARFGPPTGRYPVGGEIIMTYRYNLLARLAGRAFPGAS